MFTMFMLFSSTVRVRIRVRITLYLCNFRL